MANMPNRIYELRRERGWSQQELADRAACSKMHISGVERGKRDLSLSLMRRLAEIFGVPTAALMSRADNPMILAQDEQHLLDTYRQADADKREDLQRVADALIGFRHFPRDAA